ncbi:hypothetical protein ORI20_06995 [Mycobacterium sp. CVI_P3]|uniref:Uncharacterized protein n=1 Tax=Mycobacterium pinniadriaticum TaxID=2994102 RepID=A0ABT3SB09_9MYCO|nr:hypothetical protein [Mycobacterium pinniadriaticum]MCX2930012.1 hypothetical protein [Mycobacterium pinniadriaticum]MCX2936339.1 hypothetical protein [Mycobacterium pinniadriaticum]
MNAQMTFQRLCSLGGLLCVAFWLPAVVFAAAFIVNTTSLMEAINSEDHETANHQMRETTI